MIPAMLVGTENGLYSISENRRILRLPGRSVANLTPAHDGVWWSILDRRVIVRSADAVEWQEIVDIAEVEPACIVAAGESLWIGTSEAHVYHWDGGTLQHIESFADVPGRETWFTPWGGPPETRSLALQPDGTLFANVHVGGIPRTSDHGGTWEPTIDVRADVHQVLVHPDNPRLILAASARGFGVSWDSGEHWDLYRDGVHGHYMSAVAVVGMTAFVTTSTGSSSNARSALYRIDLNNPGRFEKTDDGLPEWFTGNINTFCLTAENDRIAFGTRAGDLFVACVDGLRWRRVASDLPPIQSVQMMNAGK